MKFIPILFSTPMVQALLDGRKTQTRRIIKQKDQPHLKYDNSCIDYSNGFGWVVKHQIEGDPDRYEITQNFKCPYGQVGDILWVRETWAPIMDINCKKPLPDAFIYKTDFTDGPVDWNWKPSLFMPKSACRIFLKIKSVRVERLQDISEEDAVSEGIDRLFEDTSNWVYYKIYNNGGPFSTLSAYRSFCSLWQSINGKQSWNDNPWVWVIEFERIEKPENFID